MSRFTLKASLLVAVRRMSGAAFVAATLLLVACGGGGSSSSGAENSRLDTKVPHTEKPSTGNSTVETDNSGTTDQDFAKDEQDSGSSTEDEAPSSEVDEPQVGEEVADNEEVTEPETAEEQTDTNDDSELVDEVVSEVSGAVRLEWDRPEFRENGEYLEGDEIGGYELRYRKLGEDDFETVVIEDGWDEDYELTELVGSYEFTIAAFDSNGLYSEFVSLSPVTGLTESI